MSEVAPCWENFNYDPRVPSLNGSVVNCKVVHSYPFPPYACRGIYICILAHITCSDSCKHHWRYWPHDLLWPLVYECIACRWPPSRSFLPQEVYCTRAAVSSWHPECEGTGSRFIVDLEQSYSNLHLHVKGARNKCFSCCCCDPLRIVEFVC